jgi:hypothetical protein
MKFELPHPLSALLLLAPLMLAPLGCDSGDEGDDEAAEDDTTDETTDDGGVDLVAGEATYTMSCALSGCHAAGADVQLSDRVPMLTDDEVIDQIRMGNDLMPSFSEAQIDAEELANLVAFLRDEFGA